MSSLRFFKGIFFQGNIFFKGMLVSRGLNMRMWLLFVLFTCLSGALYLSFGTPEYNEKASELVSQLEEM
jgi:hypothetical protein